MRPLCWICVLAVALGIACVPLAYAQDADGDTDDKVRLYTALRMAWVNTASLSPDRRLVLTTSNDGTARLWETASGREIRRIEIRTGAAMMDGGLKGAFSPDGTVFATASHNSPPQVWDVSTGSPVVRADVSSVPQFALGCFGCYSSIAFSPDGRRLIAGAADGVVRIWDAASGRLVQSLNAESEWIGPVGFSADGKHAWGSSIQESRTRLWDVESGREVARLAGGGTAAFSPDGRLAVIADRNENYAVIWDVATRTELRRLAAAEKHARPEFSEWRISALAFSPNGKHIVTGSHGMLRLWDTASGAELTHTRGHSQTIDFASFSADGSLLMTASSDRSAKLWNADTLDAVRTFEGQSESWGVGAATTAVSPDDARLLTGRQLWDLHSGTGLQRLDREPERVDPNAPFAPSAAMLSSAGLPSAFSPNGKLIVTLYGEQASLWETATARELRRFDVGHNASLAFSGDGKLLLTSSIDYSSARLWDVDSGRELRRLPTPADAKQKRVTAVALSPDGKLALIGHPDYSVRLWDVTSGKPLELAALGSKSSLPQPEPNGYTTFNHSWLAFSPDGRLALTGTFDSGTLVWDTQTWQPIRRLGTGRVLSSKFSQSGRTAIIVADYVRLYDIASGVQRLATGGQTAALLANEKLVVTGNADSTISVREMATDKELLKLLTTATGGWAVIDSQGRYDSSDPDFSPALHWVLGDRALELYQLKRRFYTKNLFGRVLCAYQGGPQCPALGDVADLQSLEPWPEVSLTTNATRGSTARVRITDMGGGVGDIVVRVNGREIESRARGIRPEGRKSADFTLNLDAATRDPQGHNKVEVFAYDRANIVASRVLDFLWETAPEQDRETRFHGVFIGTNTYEDPSLTLRYAAKDATSMAQAVGLAAANLFGRENVSLHVLASDTGSDKEPTKENLTRVFRQLSRDGRADDVLFVYFAGHATSVRISGESQYLYLTREATSGDFERDRKLRQHSTVSSEELREWLGKKGMPLKQVIVLDTCAAGAASGRLITLGDRRSFSPAQVEAMERLKDRVGSYILMGSAADSVSYEASSYGQGLLTYSLLTGMRSGQALEGNKLEVVRLFQFAMQGVTDLAQGIGGIQRPEMSVRRGQSFPIGLLDEGDRLSIRLENAKPHVLQVEARTESEEDPLNLTRQLSAALRRASVVDRVELGYAYARIVYVENALDGLPESLVPRVRYTVSDNGRIYARLTLLQNHKAVSQVVLEGDTAHLDALINEFVDRIASAK